MNKQNYKECIPVNDLDNLWLQYYDQTYINGRSTGAEDRKQESLGYKYTKNDDWYYQWDVEEKRYYVVVD